MKKINGTHFIGFKSRKLEIYFFLSFISYIEAIVKLITENVEACSKYSKLLLYYLFYVHVTSLLK